MAISLDQFAAHYKPDASGAAEPAADTGPTFTPQQVRIFRHVADDQENIVCSAVAGAGKTTTVVEAAKRARGRVGFVAFNKHIAQHLQAKLGQSARACTLHSLGFAAVRKQFPDVELEEQKAKRLLERIRPRWFFETRRGGVRLHEEGQAALNLARLCKLTLTEAPGDMAGLVDHYGLEIPCDLGQITPTVAELLTACREETDTIDFDDMVWLPVVRQLRPDRFDLLIVDEVQDLSRVMQELAAAAGTGRMLIVGDPKQSVMGFSGADTDSMPRLRDRLFGSPRGGVECPLTVTFRCPTSHVALARRLVPQIEAAPGAADGAVIHLPEDPGAVVAAVKPDDLVICRKNAPLVGLAYRLFVTGRPVLLRGRDIGKGLLDLIDRLRPTDCKDLIGRLQAYYEKEESRLIRKDAPASAFTALEDKTSSLSILAAQMATLDDLRDFITGLFTDDSPTGKTVLSSVHRAKGLEADSVFIVEPECMPMVFRCRDCRGDTPMPGCATCRGTGIKSKPWEIEQEHNLLYVAVTRAKKNLYFCGPVPTVLI